MATSARASRSALLAGASGLIGHELLPRLLEGKRYSRVDVLVRRPLAGVAASRKLKVHTLDFSRLPDAFARADDVYIALGTTIKVAGSQAGFRQVDFDAVVGVAKAARAAGATRIAVVSSLGADPKSRVFYKRVKGEMQAAIAGLGYPTVVFAQPSLLLGDRAALGQSTRAREGLATRVLRRVGGALPRDWRAIAASDVAAAMLAATLSAEPGVTILRSGRMQGAAGR